MSRLSGGRLSALDELVSHLPLGAFGERVSTDLSPRVQVDTVYGVLSTDTVDRISGGGSITATDAVVSVTSGPNVGAYSTHQSRRGVRYRPGQGSRYRFTALFDAGVADSEQFCGAFTPTDGLMFGYVGTQFGVMRRHGGRLHIAELTITTGAGSGETITVTLDGVAFPLAATAGILTTAQTAEFIAGQTGFTGWMNMPPESTGDTVRWIRDVPAAADGTYSISSTGTAVGSFAAIQTGATNETSEASGALIPQSAWNVDRLDGTRSITNPSGMVLDPAKFNVYEILHTYLGAGTIVYRVMTPSGSWQEVHRLEYPGSAEGPSSRNPSLALGWGCQSTGSTTPVTIKGASAAGFVEGPLEFMRDPFAQTVQVTSTTTETVAIALRVRSEFVGIVNRRECLPHTLTMANETSNRLVAVRIYLNPTITGFLNWTPHNVLSSAMDVSTATGLTPTGGTLVIASSVGGSNGRDLALHEHDIRFEPGDTLVITTRASAAGSTTADLGITWHEF